MGIIDNIKNKFNEMAERNKETKEFKKAVEAEILPIKRAGYLAQKKGQAYEEGKLIAKKELEKKQVQETKPVDMFLPTKKWDFGIVGETGFIEKKTKSNKSNGRKKTNGN